MVDGKSTLRETLEQVEMSSGVRPEQLNLPEYPEQVNHVWDWFLELHETRSQKPITYSEIYAWSKLSGIYPNPSEVRIIREIDSCYLKVIHAHYNR